MGANCPNAIRMAVALSPGTICVMETIKPSGKYAAIRHGSITSNAPSEAGAPAVIQRNCTRVA